ncbi:MAG: ribonuclease R [Rhodospirillaceae bacterium]|nr:ribonuclease R [Rhodospirillaceae bacterium]
MRRVIHYLGKREDGATPRDIARALNLTETQGKKLDQALDLAEAAGRLQKARGGRYLAVRRLPPVGVIEVTGIDEDGEILARLVGKEDAGAAPRITVVEKRRGGRGGAKSSLPALGPGDRALARLNQAADGYQAEIMRRLNAAPKTVLGIYDGNGRIQPTDRHERNDLSVPSGTDAGAGAGELVVAEVESRRRAGLLEARIIEKLGIEPGSRAYSQIAIHNHGLPSVFSPAALAEAEAAGAASADGRTDLRHLHLVTIDGEDARDFDDAVWAEPVGGADGSWKLTVAIADVAEYVRPGSALDGEAEARGNSVYFPDRVVPMLPEALSNGWCSLKPGEDRACLAAHLVIDENGKILSHRFERALMRSAARLTYAEVQASRDGGGELPAATGAAVRNLFGAFEALARGRDARHTLELEIPEQKIELDADGEVIGIGAAERLDSHRLIEEFMIAANVAAAEALEKARQPFLYRIHDEPPADKLDAFREFIASIGLNLAKGQLLRASDFNRLIRQSQALEDGHMVDDAVLRAQAQAEYAPTNIGHFGLGLRRYCHFTSPIRRYADLLVHRALITGLGLGPGGLRKDADADWHELGASLSEIERRAVAAERDVKDRFAAAYYAKHDGQSLPARISGVTRHGLFVTIIDTLADGFIPMRYLPDDYYRLDEPARRLKGRRTKLVFQIGDLVTCKLRDSEPLRGSLVLEIIP